MLILKSHALILDTLKRFESGASLEELKRRLFEIETEIEKRLHELECQNLVFQEPINSYRLTDSGWLIVKAIEAVEPAIGKVGAWQLRSRFIGSEVIHMLETSKLVKGQVATTWKQALEEKGFAKDGSLTPAADLVLDAYRNIKPKLMIGDKVATYIKRAMPGPGTKDMLPRDEVEPLLLEAMGLIATSPPTSDIYCFTDLGQKIKRALLRGITVEDALKSPIEPIMRHSPFRINSNERFVLFSIVELWEKNKENETIFPEVAQIEKYVNEKMKTPLHQKFDVSMPLYMLEALDLIEPRLHQQTYTAYDLTSFGKQVYSDQKIKGRDIHSAAVKSLIPSNHAPNLEWYNLALREGLIASASPTDSGLLYSNLAKVIKRKPHLSRIDRMVLSFIPHEEGIFASEIVEKSKEVVQKKGVVPAHPARVSAIGDEENINESIDKLEALGILELLSNNAVILTEAGKLLKGAVALETNLSNPVTPNMIRILRSAASSLSIKKHGKKIEVKDWKDVQKRSGLDAKSFRNELVLLKEGKFIEANFVTELGGLLLEAARTVEENKLLEL